MARLLIPTGFTRRSSPFQDPNSSIAHDIEVSWRDLSYV